MIDVDRVVALLERGLPVEIFLDRVQVAPRCVGLLESIENPPVGVELEESGAV